jgi:hypothetical protein
MIRNTYRRPTPTLAASNTRLLFVLISVFLEYGREYRSKRDILSIVLNNNMHLLLCQEHIPMRLGSFIKPVPRIFPSGQLLVKHVVHNCAKVYAFHYFIIGEKMNVSFTQRD